MGVKRWWQLTVPVFLLASTVGATTFGTFTTTTFTTTTLTGTTSTTSTLAGSLAPVANAGPDQFTQTLSTLTFNGSGSFDPGGTIVSYAWRFGDGGTASGIAVTHAYATAGVYTATLTVTDSRGASASDTAVVRVADRPPVANAGPDQSGILGSAVTLRGSGSDPDGTITSYRWDFGDGASASGATASHAYATAGTYTAKLTVTDDRGAQASDSALVAIAGSAAGTPWARGFGGAASDVGYGLAVDSSGNTVMTGRVESGVDFGGGVVCQPATVFVSKYSPTGARLWSKCLGGVRGRVQRRRQRGRRRRRRQRRDHRDRRRHGELRRRADRGQRLHDRRGQVLACRRAPLVEGLRGLVLELRQCRGGGPERQHRGDRRVLGPGRLRRRYAVQLRRRRLPRQALS